MSFTGKKRDNESGLDYFGARYYSNGLGRFITPDPMGSLQPNKNPQTLNLYSYGLDNPMRFSDDGFNAADRIRRAEHEIGRDYLVFNPSGKGDNGGIDCSGLCLTAVSTDIPKFPRTAADQYQLARDHDAFSTDSSAVQPGDEIFFANKDGTIDHVAIVTKVNPDGSAEMIEAPHKGTKVTRRILQPQNFKYKGSWGAAHVAGYGLWHKFDKPAVPAEQPGGWTRFTNWIQSLFSIIDIPSGAIPAKARRDTKTAYKTALPQTPRRRRMRGVTDSFSAL